MSADSGDDTSGHTHGSPIPKRVRVSNALRDEHALAPQQLQLDIGYVCKCVKPCMQQLTVAALRECREVHSRRSGAERRAWLLQQLHAGRRINDKNRTIVELSHRGFSLCRPAWSLLHGISRTTVDHMIPQVCREHQQLSDIPTTIDRYVPIPTHKFEACAAFARQQIALLGDRSRLFSGSLVNT